jgi:hypothetical protein
MALKYEDLLIPDGQSETIKKALDDIYSKTAVGNLSTAISDTFHGLNHRKQPNSIPINKDDHGLTFFTRPRMNMTRDNLRQVRQFVPMLTNNAVSIPRAIRALLDTDSQKEEHGSPLVDPFQAFIPILTNQLITISGWPDVVAPTYTSKPGVYKEAYSHVDGVVQNYENYSFQANFRNIQGDPITALFLTWVLYSSLVFQGIVVPYPDMIIENEIDYQTRIYRLVLDPSRRFVQKIGACGAAYPFSVPLGTAFNIDAEQPYSRANEQISISFQVLGAMYQDDILIEEFNKTVILHNSKMAGENDADRQSGNDPLVKIEPALYNTFNHMGYPRINPDTYELEWWIWKREYDEMLSSGAAPDDDDFFIGRDQ